MRNVVGFIVLASVLLANAQRVSAQTSGVGTEQWRREVNRQILSYLHVHGTDLVLAIRAIKKNPPNKDEVRLHIAVSPSGRITSVATAKPSRYPGLDGFAVQIMRRAGPLPAVPTGKSINLMLPVRYNSIAYSPGEFFSSGR